VIESCPNDSCNCKGLYLYRERPKSIYRYLYKLLLYAGTVPYGNGVTSLHVYELGAVVCFAGPWFLVPFSPQCNSMLSQ
jgi:hypothetical protein